MDHSEIKNLPKADYTPAELDYPSRLLLRAAAVLEAHGHCKGRAQDQYGAHCVSGAITQAGFELDGYSMGSHDEAVRRLDRYVGGNIVAWNDDGERTKDEVVAALRSAAISA